jgi:organic radical activating enzyme
MKNKNTFCVIPFTRAYTTNNGLWQHCCFGPPRMENGNGQYFSIKDHSIVEVWNSQYMKNLRLDLINGVKNTNCEYCWNREDNGAHSHRIKSNNIIYIDKDIIDSAINNDGNLDTMPEGINIKLGNLCNLKCITCNPLGSSMHKDEVATWKTINVQLPNWIADIDKHELEADRLSEIDLRKLNVDIMLTNIRPMLRHCREITVLGGEPFVHPMTEKILKLCVTENIANNISIEIITNLTILNQHHIEYFSKFKESKIVVSYDHIDADKFKYIRFPAPYRKFKKNFDKLMTLANITKKISTTFSIFNIFDFREIFDEFELVRNSINETLYININLVSEPNYFDIKYLENYQKKQIITSMNQYLEKNKNYRIFVENKSFYNYLTTIKEFLNMPVDDFNNVVLERTRVLNLYDITRGTKYKELFPFIKEYNI